MLVIHGENFVFLTSARRSSGRGFFRRRFVHVYYFSNWLLIKPSVEEIYERLIGAQDSNGRRTAE